MYDIVVGDSISIMLKRANIEIDRIANQLLIPYGLTYSQFKILKFTLMNKNRNIRQIDIEQFFYMTNPTVTGLLQTLEKKMICRTTNPEDKRSKLIHPTDDALQLEEELQCVAATLEKHFTTALSGEQEKQLKGLLQSMLGNIVETQK
ncbi:MAG: MarR family transcriptional regulator [Lachnospiraceae bacterium]|nr:MarR family transcriptional regulator [Lachnospiraceae bacterium]